MHKEPGRERQYAIEQIGTPVNPTKPELWSISDKSTGIRANVNAAAHIAITNMALSSRRQNIKPQKHAAHA